jgi:ABC-2 type transport system ATP-binding protein
MTHAIETHQMGRDFKKLQAVVDLELSIQAGEIFGLLGPDGAGKTTTLRLLAGLLDLSAGSAQVAGLDLAHQAEQIKRRIGYMAQQFSLYGDLSVVENLEFFAELFDVPRSERATRMESLLHFARLEEFKNRRAAHLSGGMQKKLALACTLIHEPEILLLDEPTTGVDPVSRREFWEILNELYLQGTTIVITTPYMDEAERCGRVGLMYAGRLVRCAPPRQLLAELRGDLLEIIPDDWQAAIQVVRRQPGVLEAEVFGEKLRIIVDSIRQRDPEIRRALQQAGLKFHGARQAPVRMEDAFIALIREMEAG